MTNNTITKARSNGFARVKLLFALSRIPHSLIDMTTPAFCALLWLGRFPTSAIVLLGTVTAFAGYMAVYALNDVVDHRVDREKIRLSQEDFEAGDIDAALERHPIAQGSLSFVEGLAWSAAWAVVALLGAYLLNPVCVLFFFGGCVLEILYCRMLKVSFLRALISGVVKTLGGVAAIFAVDPDPSPLRLGILFVWLFLWEIGAQNIPADWKDLDADRIMGAQTIPVRFGPARTRVISLAALVLAVFMGILFFMTSPLDGKPILILTAVALGGYLLIWPAIDLYRAGTRREVLRLFSKASYYPLAMFVLVLAGILFQSSFGGFLD